MFSRFKIFALLFLVLILFSTSALSQPVWEKELYQIFLKDNILTIFHDQSKMMEIQSFQFNFIEPDTMIVEKVNADTLILKLEFGETDGFHEDFPSRIFLTISHFNNTIHFSAAHPSFNHITIKMKDLNEHYFGLIEKCYPHNSKNPDLRGNVVDVDVYGNGNQEYSENYASAYSAFYMSSLGYGSFFDTFARGRYHLAVNGVTEIYHQTNALDWYIFYGPTGEKIHREYFNIIGKPKYVPIWACGPIFWRDQNNGGKNEILSDIRKFTELKIPLTACWVDRPYSNGANEWSKMDFNEKFSAPEKWIKTINKDYGLEFITWVGPMTFQDPNFPGRFPLDPGYFDLTYPEALEEFEKRLNKYQYSAGVRGHKMDRADENFPLTAEWHEPVSQSESRNKYVYLYSKVIHEFLSNAHGKNQFNFARSAFHRCQPFLSGLWGGDSRSNWQGMAGNQANAVRCGFMGFPVWGQDTGGYLGSGRIDETLYIRWLQWGVWNGMFEIKIDGSGGNGEDRPPWKYSKKLQSLFREMCNQRMQLLPYIYSCANTSYKNGVLMKPLAYSYPNDDQTYTIWDEYIFCDAFLIVPVFTKENRRTIYLPEGTWVALNDPNDEYAGPATLMKEVPIETIPVFIKENSIYVTGQIYQGNAKKWMKAPDQNSEITIHLFPGKIGEKTTFTYVDYFDGDSEKEMGLQHHSEGIRFHSDALMNPSRIELRYAAKPEQIVSKGKSVLYKFDKKRHVTVISIEKNQPINLEVIIEENQ